MMSTAWWDVETTGLSPTNDRLLTCVVADSAGGVYVFGNIESSLDDMEIAIDIRDALESYDEVIGWYSSNFDVPFLDARLKASGERRLLQFRHLDLGTYLKKVHPNRPSTLDYYAKALGLEYQKTPFDREIWGLASSGDASALKTIVTHNIQDTLATKEVYERIFGVEHEV